MNLFKALWPMPFKIKKGKFWSFIFRTLAFALLCAFAIGAMGMLSHIKFIGDVTAVLGIIAELYGIIGIVLCVLVFFGIVKTRKKSSKRRKRSKKR